MNVNICNILKIRFRSPLLRLLLLWLCFTPRPIHANSGTDSKTIGKIASIIGKTFLIREGSEILCQKNLAVRMNDKLVTQKNAALKISLVGNDSFVLGEDSSILVSEYLRSRESASLSAVQILKGSVRFFIKPKSNSQHNILTAQSAMGVRGTSGYISIKSDGGEVFELVTGKVTIASKSDPANSRELESGQRIEVRKKIGSENLVVFSDKTSVDSLEGSAIKEQFMNILSETESKEDNGEFDKEAQEIDLKATEDISWESHNEKKLFEDAKFLEFKGDQSILDSKQMEAKQRVAEAKDLLKNNWQSQRQLENQNRLNKKSDSPKGTLELKIPTF